MRWLRYFDKDWWQMREALAYPMPSWVADRWPGQFDNGGTNPHKCGLCEARRRNPDLYKSERQ